MEKTSHFRDEEYDDKRLVETPLDLVETIRIKKAKLIRYKDNNEKIIKAQEKKIELNAVLLQSLSEIQKHL
jgi:hypothetical protein